MSVLHFTLYIFNISIQRSKGKGPAAAELESSSASKGKKIKSLQSELEAVEEAQKSAIPEGFFDNVKADAAARNIDLDAEKETKMEYVKVPSETLSLKCKGGCVHVASLPDQGRLEAVHGIFKRS